MTENNGQLKEAIEVLKDLKRLSTIPMTLREGIDTMLLNRAIDTVVAEVENPPYTSEDMESFAEWLIGRSADWITDEERCETAETFIELWEQERRAK